MVGRLHDHPHGIQKGSQIMLHRMVFAVDIKQSFNLVDEESFLLLGWSVYEKTSFESVEIEKNVPWAKLCV